MFKNLIKTLSLIFFSLLIGIILCEMILRIKHNFLINYDIEMWKYAKILKKKVENKKINHVHVIKKSANLQKVEIKINNYGQRDINFTNQDLLKYDRRFLILGSSVALGWGVDSKDTFSNFLNKKSINSDKKWIFINGGVGNYNAERYINNYLENWKSLNFTDIIIHFFVNDSELIVASETNFFTENFHLGVVLWKLFNSYKSQFNQENIKEYYSQRFEDTYPGFIIAKQEIKNLMNHCKKQNINCHLILMPDIHKLSPYNLNFINKKMNQFSQEIGISFFDLLPALQITDSKKLWNKYKDPHPNKYAHSIIGDAIFNYLNK